MPLDQYDTYQPSAADIRRWFDTAPKTGSKYLIVMTDLFSGDMYPMYTNMLLPLDDEFNKAARDTHGPMIYDLTKSFENARV